MAFFSQFNEDRILDDFFGPEKIGVCVEVGANDGVYGSTTLAFERKGWTCVLVEPNPDLCAQLRRERTGQVFECGASDHEGVATLFIATGSELAHGVSRIGTSDVAPSQIKAYGFDSRPVEVRLRTLDSILEEAQITSQIDFISIDVEGLELAVLRGLSLQRWRPRILLVEDNDRFRNDVVRDHLLVHGYVPIRRTGVNDWFAHEADTELATASNRGRYARARAYAPWRNLGHRIVMGVAGSRVGSAMRRMPLLRPLLRRARRVGQ